MHFNNPDDTLTDAQVADEIKTKWIGDVNGVGIHQWQVQSIKWISIKVQRLASSLPAPFNLTISRPGVQSADNGLCTVLAGILKFSTTVGGRKGRGRIYVPGVQAGFTDLGLTSATFHTYADTPIAGMNSRFCNNPGPNGPLELLVGPRSGVVLADFNHVTQISLSNFVGIQRRRNIGFGI
jgi:hypothetical protein